MAALRVRLTSEPDERCCLESPYHQGLVEQLKATLPLGAREWDASRKRWLISALYVTDLLTLLHGLGAQVSDERATSQSLAPVPAMPEDLKQGFDTLHLAYTAPLGLAEMAYKFWSRYVHPDMGGDVTQFHAVNDAITTIRQYLNTKDTTDDDDPLPF